MWQTRLKSGGLNRTSRHKLFGFNAGKHQSACCFGWRQQFVFQLVVLVWIVRALHQFGLWICYCRRRLVIEHVVASIGALRLRRYLRCLETWDFFRVSAGRTSDPH